MYSNLNLYYLEQLGIKPWVTRQSTQPGLNPLNESKPMIVFIDSALSPKARNLMRQMLAFIGKSHEQFNEVSDTESLLSSLSKSSVVINFTKQSKPEKANEWINCPHPEFLLSHPKEKKSALLELMKLKAVISES